MKTRGVSRNYFSGDVDQFSADMESFERNQLTGGWTDKAVVLFSHLNLFVFDRRWNRRALRFRECLSNDRKDRRRHGDSRLTRDFDEIQQSLLIEMINDVFIILETDLLRIELDEGILTMNFDGVSAVFFTPCVL